MFDKWSRLEKLNNLRQAGALSEEEFSAQKAALLAPRSPINLKPVLYTGAFVLLVAGSAAAIRATQSAHSGPWEDYSTAAATATDAATTAADAAADASFAEATAKPPVTFTADELATAFALRYGSKATEQVAGGVLNYFPKRLIVIKDQTLAMISEGKWEGDPCHACYGALRVDYIRWRAGNFELPDHAVQFTEEGQGWGQPPEWKLVASAGLPSIKVKSAYAGQGCVDERSGELKLTPAGVVKVTTKGTQDCSAGPDPAAAPEIEAPAYAKVAR